MINCEQLRKLIITPSLNDLKMLTEDACELMVFTVAVESMGGTYIKQLNGPALGIFQMEPKTYNDIWQNYIMHNSSLMLKLLYNFDAPTMPDETRLIYDLRFATAMARIHYKRVKEALPKACDINDIWTYYKKYYNTSKGDAEYYKALSAYNQFTGKSHTVASSNCS